MAQQLLYVWLDESLNTTLEFSEDLARQLNKNLRSSPITGFNAATELKKNDIILFICQLSPGKNVKKQVKKYLALFRDVRVPYLFVKADGANTATIQHIMAPVNFLPEEKEKASWCNNLGRMLKVRVTLLQPKDHGKRAARNVQFIHKLLLKTGVPSDIAQGTKPSDKIEKEALNKLLARNENHALLMISASRAYSLDDVFFGPKELHVIRRANFPVLVINPRDDIYELCGD